MQAFTTETPKAPHGSQEWAASHVNIQDGCEHDCRYCYAKTMAIRFKRATAESWKHPRLRPHDLERGYTRRQGRIMFPTAHDITDRNLEFCLSVLRKMLTAGNDVLIVSKPTVFCAERLCAELDAFKRQIVFRFSIGSADDAVHPETDPVKLWRWYIQLTQAEAAFRSAKSDLAMRPVYHQIAYRVESHILVCFLALALWRTLEQWMNAKGLGSCGRQLLMELDKLHSVDVLLPVENGPELRLRMVVKPEKPLAFLLAKLGLSLPKGSKKVENVVEKNEV